MKGFEALNAFWETFRSIFPLTAFLVFIQLVVIRKPIENVKEFVIGFILSVLGLHFFLQGVSMSLFPIGDSVGSNLVVLERKWLIIIIGFVIGYFGTLVEPALKALALEVEEISIGAIPNKILIHAVAIGFGSGMAIGLLRILNGIPYLKVAIPLLLLVILLSFFAPEQYVSIAMDSASATTGPVNIPLNMALAIGLAKVIKGADPLLSGFGIVGLTSLGAIISVLTLGILTRI
ncbi:DUF1538 domain-containing protein [Tepidimicrobium xylanilyticum]|uniref:DUF1538 domain-containing protein n=1 Tax=Tepidimicrobium xylanilyticum TaxID=1123352 RepID=UPI00264BF4C5|nr:DUF1538 domain-containing protein [Tepidimicrobium xylanilyticum]GMG97456.1 hypothetical protein EN5CB1_22820 [Tepidimicrobium xylanilyticum]